jgi:hypothetical protein
VNLVAALLLAPAVALAVIAGRRHDPVAVEDRAADTAREEASRPVAEKR